MNVNNSCNNEEEEETKLIISSLLTDMIMKVLLMRQQHLEKLYRECVHRYQERKWQRNTIEHMRKVREKNEKIDKCVDQRIVIMKACCKVVNRLI